MHYSGWAMNLKKRIESSSSSTVSVTGFPSESQKENWKMIMLGQNMLNQIIFLENLKKRIERFRVRSTGREGCNGEESQKENWKVYNRPATPSSPRQNLKKRIESCVRCARNINCAYGESQKENWKAFHKTPLARFRGGVLESQKENWKLNPRSISGDQF